MHSKPRSPACYSTSSGPAGFTLIELSIVLVIIALLAGGVLVGRDLIAAAQIRAQISQIDKYNQAVNVFQAKYNCLPGDCLALKAIQAGLATRAGSAGRGDGNGLLEGAATGSSNHCGEIALFWNDLSHASLISDTILTTIPGGEGDVDGDLNHCPSHPLPDYSATGLLPSSKINPSGSISVFSVAGSNFFGILGSVCIAPQSNGYCYVQAGDPAGLKTGLTPLQALALDTKIDNGYPATGTVVSIDPGTFSNSAAPSAGPADTASAGDCGNTDTVPTSYNTGGPYANAILCSISVQFQ